MFASSADSPEQEKILRQLKELFFRIPNWRLRKICLSNNWNLELCINQLMNSTSSEETKENSEMNNARNFAAKPQESKPKGKATAILSDQEQKVGELIKKGYRVMVLMRGPPGVGKSYCSRSIVTNFVDLKPPYSKVEDFVFSSDDYFRNAKSGYKYNVSQLSDAHEFNQKRVRENAGAGLSPIIVDNTNMQLWEMTPYVQAAVRYGYMIEIVEPQTPWRKCVYKLSQRNKHGVSSDKIRRMLDKYEKGDVSALMKMLKNTKYTVSLPVLRSLPPIATDFEKHEEVKVNFGDINDPRENPLFADTTSWGSYETNTSKDQRPKTIVEDTNSWGSYDTNAPKSQRKKIKCSISPVAQDIPNCEQKISAQTPASYHQNSPIKSASERDVYSLLEKKMTNVWKPYEAESIDFWSKDLQKGQQLYKDEPTASTSSGQNDKTINSVGNKSLLELLREESKECGNSETELAKNNDKESEAALALFERHSVDCSNENPIFVTLRQIYPNKQISGLWDLFQKCNGDIDWAVDILLKEDELAKLRNIDDSYAIDNYDDVFVCSCSNQMPNTNNSQEHCMSNINLETFDYNELGSNNVDSKVPPHRPQRSRFARANHASNPVLQEVKENVENCFVLGDDHYSEHLLKIRNFRSGLLQGAAPSSTSTPVDNCGNGENQRENPDDDEDDDDDDIGNIDDDMLEMSLGEHLVQQLLDNFRNESSLEERIPPSLPLNLKVFMPRSLAKQLYMLWMESAYNHLEEERQQMMREDEEFARLLKHPQYSEYKQSPSNLREMLDIEYAWTLCKRDKEELDHIRNEQEKQSRPNDLATHLTQMKLCETFPDIPRETLLDILATTDNNYNDTVSILRSTMKVNEKQTEEDQLHRHDHKETPKQRDNSRGTVWEDNENNIGDPSFSPEDAKRQALRAFEDARNLAAHHCQLRAECFQKAKEAIQAGNGGAGLYYSQIANLHKQKIDTYNHRAANCIMNAHKYTQNNPDHLDLHYLHLLEALGCLDLFLDRHITALRLASRSYKYIFIITGRGKHSAGGVSVIKSKVKSRLEERCLKWNEVNPGLLKVKVFSSSRHSQNF